MTFQQINNDNFIEKIIYNYDYVGIKRVNIIHCRDHQMAARGWHAARGRILFGPQDHGQGKKTSPRGEKYIRLFSVRTFNYTTDKKL